eukprot:Plantae.Rhodophyta-Purpureofilum_apyrenoidigerum.ctg19902.p2 GENE.Plantae.Rhodophyta-Purpureofilum_apyrenoidigerum.ctg19902~~Plantae.Rhodophyta-Purpureofilum_apyrenoidigerum.ctg19902.p2  ORF type:complete len:124 (+),score=21.77 Plantae.Rhodophyta-Purpureofilum_apyrenoidigerum.ctg19902:194-565(+)
MEAFIGVLSNRPGYKVGARVNARRTVRMAMATKKIEIIRQADEVTINKLGCRSWPTWGCEASKFPWTYDENEKCLLLKGEVTVTPDDGGEAVSFKAGDIVTFPEGMSCTWDVKEAVHKHYQFY